MSTARELPPAAVVEAVRKSLDRVAEKVRYVRRHLDNAEANASMARAELRDCEAEETELREWLAAHTEPESEEEAK